MSEQPIKGLVFDMDGLLFDSERVVQKSWNEVGRQMGFGERFGDHIYHTIGFNVVRREQYFKEHVSPDFPMEEFTENTRRIYHRIMEEDGVDRKPGAEELLKYAKEHGYRLALATSSRELHAQLLLKKYGLFDLFRRRCLWKYGIGGEAGSRDLPESLCFHSGFARVCNRTGRCTVRDSLGSSCRDASGDDSGSGRAG